MKNRNHVKTSLPNGLVVVDKGSDLRNVMVGILNGNRMPSFGFDVRGMAPNHFRIVEHGQFGIVIGARQALEVRVLLDGKLMLETTLTPYAQPSPMGMDPALYRRMVESPQAHYLVQDANGKPFMFTPHDSALSLDDVVAEQIHTGRMSAPPTLSQIDREGEVFEELRVDLDPADFGFGVKDPTDADTDFATSDADTRVGDNLTNATGAEDNSTTMAEANTDGDAESGFTRAAPRDDADPTIERINPAVQAKSWAPSHGLVAVGIRMIQSVEQGEMIPTAPDGFSYTLFQMNPWKLHNKVHAKVMGRVIVPTTAQLAQMTIDEGFANELSGNHDHVSCGLKHKHR